MAIETGLDWLIYVDTAESEGSPSWAKFPQQKEGPLEWSSDSEDATNKDDAGWKNSIGTGRGVGITVDGMVDPADTAFSYMIYTVAFGTTTHHNVHLKFENEDGDTVVGWFGVTSVNLNPGLGIATYSFSFESRGEIVANEV